MFNPLPKSKIYIGSPSARGFKLWVSPFLNAHKECNVNPSSPSTFAGAKIYSGQRPGGQQHRSTLSSQGL